MKLIEIVFNFNLNINKLYILLYEIISFDIKDIL